MSVCDVTLELLLDLHGQTIFLDNGYWVKFQAQIVKPGMGRTQGVKYSLTLHDRSGKRMIGYDNAHAIPGRSNNVEYDHKHHARHESRVKAYHYVSAEKLLQDFWKDVDDFLNED